MTLIHIWASHGPVDSGPYLEIIGSWILSYTLEPHLDLVTLVPPGPHLDLEALLNIWGSPGPASCGLHLASPGTQ